MISKQTGRANLGWHAVVKSVDKEEKGNVATLALLPVFYKSFTTVYVSRLSLLVSQAHTLYVSRRVQTTGHDGARSVKPYSRGWGSADALHTVTDL